MGGDEAATGKLISVTAYKRKHRKERPCWISFRLPSGRRVRKPASHGRDLAEMITWEEI